MTLAQLYNRWVNALVKQLKDRKAYEVILNKRDSTRYNIMFSSCNKSDFESVCSITMFFKEPKRLHLTALTVYGKRGIEMAIDDTDSVIAWFDKQDVLK